MLRLRLKNRADDGDSVSVLSELFHDRQFLNRYAAELHRKLPPLDKKYCTPISTPVPTAEPDYSLLNKPDLGKKTLHEKSDNPEVYWLQRTLKDMGYYDTKCTGKMLKKTVNAVKAFQKDHGLYASGTVDQKLIDLIVETALGGTQEPEPTPAP